MKRIKGKRLNRPVRTAEKTFGLCSVGHAITDIILAIPESQLLELEIRKGSRSLVEPAFLEHVLKRFQSIKPTLGAGGSAANSLAAFSRIGGKSIFMSKAGDDKLSRYFQEEMRKAGVECRFKIVAGQPGGKCLVLVTPDGERTMLTNRGAGQVLGSECIDKQAIAESAWFLAEGYLLPDSFEAVQEALSVAKAGGVNVALSLSDVALVKECRDKFIAVLPSVDIVIGNQEEVCALCEESNLERALDKLSTDKAKALVTMGDKGAWLIEGQEKTHIPAFPCKPLDSTGAGDVFAGAFLYGIHRGYTARQAAIGAAYVAMKSIIKVGARFDYSLKPEWEKAMSEISANGR